MTREEKGEEVGAETGLVFNVGESEVIQALDLVIPLMEAGVNILQTCNLKIAEKINSLRFLALQRAFKRVLKSLKEHLSINLIESFIRSQVTHSACFIL